MRRPGLLLGVLGFLVVTIGWYLLFISSTNAEIAEARDQLEQEQDQELRLETQLKRLQRIQENQLLYVEALGAVEAAIPPTPQQAALLDDLARLEAESGVVLDGITISLPQELEGADYLFIPMSLVIEGQYFEVLGFVYGLEDLDRIVVVRSVTISSAEDDEGFTILRVSIGAEAYTTTAVTPPPSEEQAQPPAEGEETTTTTTGGDE